MREVVVRRRTRSTDSQPTGARTCRGQSATPCPPRANVAHVGLLHARVASHRSVSMFLKKDRAAAVISGMDCPAPRSTRNPNSAGWVACLLNRQRHDIELGLIVVEVEDPVDRIGPTRDGRHYRSRRGRRRGPPGPAPRSKGPASAGGRAPQDWARRGRRQRRHPREHIQMATRIAGAKGGKGLRRPSR